MTIINRALSFIGERPITNPDAPETPAGKHIANGFEQSRREVLRRYPWNFAEVWAEVDKTTAPSFGYDDAYAFPEGFLRLLFVGDPDETRTDYRLLLQPSESRRVIAIDNGGESKLKIGYTHDVTQLSLWDPLAAKVFALWMALDAAKAVTGQKEHVVVLNGLLSDELKDAIGVDGQEQAIRMLHSSYVQQERDLAHFGGDFFTNVDFY